MRMIKIKNKRLPASRDERGQTLIMFVFVFILLILFVGLTVDFGLAFVTKARMSKAVDAACLMGARNLSGGTNSAAALAVAAFNANYQQTGLDVSWPLTPTVNFTTDAQSNTLLGVTATTRINTHFIRVLPAWKTLGVASSAQAVHVNLLMMLILDRSGSMGGNGGAAAMPGAVSSFIDNFNDAKDRVGISSFASEARLDMAIQKPFRTLVKSKTNPWPANGRTFSDGGLSIAYNQFQTAVVAPGENVTRVAVFMTDGYANTFQYKFNCSATVLNLGQSDPPGSSWSYNFMNSSTGANTTCTDSQFTSIDGNVKSISVNNQNIWTEGQLRALATARAMRTDSTHPVTIYSIGLGNNLNQDFLRNIANDPLGSQYNPAQPSGEAVFAPNAAQLQAVFQDIASKILLRLTQ